MKKNCFLNELKPISALECLNDASADDTSRDISTSAYGMSVFPSTFHLKRAFNAYHLMETGFKFDNTGFDFTNETIIITVSVRVATHFYHQI